MRRVVQFFSGALSLVALLVGWLFLAPPQLGGSASHAVIVGSSMEPTLHRGDLVLMRPAGEYRIGDVVGYQSSALKQLVLHRIVGQNGDRFVFKGDNNGFLDPVQPTREELVGKLWLRLPVVGRLSEWVRRPVHSAILAGVFVLLALGVGGETTRRRRHSRGQAATSARRSRLPLPASPGRNIQTALVFCGVAVVLFAGLGALAFSQPERRAVPTNDLYEQRGSFAYSAAVGAGAVYQDGEVDTGEPVFLKLVDSLRVSFAYRLESKLPVDVQGKARLRARLGDAGGWAHMVVLAPTRTVRGPSFVLAGKLDLRKLVSTVERFRKATGSINGIYTLELRPELELAGSVGARAISDSFSPRLAFTLDGERLALAREGVSDQAPQSALTQRKAGLGTRVEANRLMLARFELEVERARRIALAGGALALLGALAAALAGLRAGRSGDEVSRIEAKYGSWLVPVAPRRHSAENVVEVESIDALARLAERYERMILHERSTSHHGYIVEEGGLTYRYLIGSPAMPEELPPEQPRLQERPSRLHRRTLETRLLRRGR